MKEEIWRNTGDPNGERTQPRAREGQTWADWGDGQASSTDEAE